MTAASDTTACYVYVIGAACTDGPRTYVGWTLDLDRRLAQHNSGRGARSTRGRLWCLLYAEKYDDRRAAMSREWHLKRDRKLRKLLAATVVTQSGGSPPGKGRSAATNPKTA